MPIGLPHPDREKHHHNSGACAGDRRHMNFARARLTIHIYCCELFGDSLLSVVQERPTSHTGGQMKPRFCAVLCTLLFSLTQAWSAVSFMPAGPQGGYIRSLARDDSGFVYAATYLGGLYRSEDGSSWTQLYTDTLKADFRSVAVNSKGYVYGGTDGFGVLRTKDGGTTWTRLGGLLYTGTVRALYVLPNDVILAGSLDGVFQSDNDGDSFAYTSTGLTNKSVTSFAQIDSTHLLVATQGGGVFGSSDAGFTWSLSSTGMQLNDLGISGIAVRLGDEVWAAAGSQLYKSVDGAATWSSVHPVALAGYSGITFTPDGTIYAAATSINQAIGGGVFKSLDDSGSVWAAQSGLENIAHFAITSVGPRVFAGTEGLGVYYSDSSPDSQNVWTQGVNGMNNTHITGIEQLDDTTFFAITKFAGEFTSFDRGASWMKVSSGIPHELLNTIAVNPVNNHLFIASASYTYRSVDRGSTFQKIRNSGATVLKCDLQGTLYAGYGGTVSRSVTDGDTWTSTFTGVNNIADIAFDGDTIYLATGNPNGSTGQGVYRSVDLSVSYGPYNNGLTDLNVTTVSVDVDSLHSGSCPTVTVGTKGSGEFALTYSNGEWGSSGLQGKSVVQIRDFSTSSKFHLGIAAVLLYARDATCKENILALTPFEMTGIHGIRSLLANGPLRSPLDNADLLIGSNGQGLFLGTVTVTSVGEDRPSIPVTAQLEQNYPNPFNPETRIEYTIGGGRDQGSGVSETGVRGQGLGVRMVRLAVYDILGREVAVLVDGPKGPGTYSVTWNAAGHASGTYICQLSVGGNLISKKMMVLR